MSPSERTVFDVATAVHGMRSQGRWKAASLEFELTAPEEFSLKHNEYSLYCTADHRPSAGLLWRFNKEEDHKRFPPYLLIPAGFQIRFQFCAGRHRVFLFQFPPDMLADWIAKPSAPSLVCGLSMGSHQLIQLALGQLTATPDEAGEIAEDLSCTLLVSAARMLSIPPSAGVAIEVSESVDIACEYIRKNIRSKRPALSGMSELTGLSERHLQRKFKEEMRMSLQDYVASYRIDVAKELLQDPRVALKKIAYDLGYTNPSHFTRSFKVATGVAPSEFQRGLLESKKS